MTKLTIIGAGSMSEALISGIVSSNLIKRDSIFVTNRHNQKRLETLHTQYGINYSYDLPFIVSQADIILLAIKPKDVKTALHDIQTYIPTNSLIISVLAGVDINSIQQLIKKEVAIARAMPNTSATVGKSATAIALNSFVKEPQKQFIQQLFETVGLSTFVEESQLDAVTGLSGSGPAYLYYVIEAMEKGAAEIGLDDKIAKALIVETLVGAAEMVATSYKTPQELRKNITSPGGTTEAGIRILETHHVQQAFVECIKEATQQSKRMGKAISNELKITN